MNGVKHYLKQRLKACHKSGTLDTKIYMHLFSYKQNPLSTRTMAQSKIWYLDPHIPPHGLSD